MLPSLEGLYKSFVKVPVPILCRIYESRMCNMTGYAQSSEKLLQLVSCISRAGDVFRIKERAGFFHERFLNAGSRNIPYRLTGAYMGMA